MSFISHVRFDVKADQRDEFISAFEEAGMLTRPQQIEGYRWGKLSEACDGASFIVTAEWDSEQDYARWQGMSFAELDKAIIKRFLSTFENPKPGKLFKTLLESPAST